MRNLNADGEHPQSALVSQITVALEATLAYFAVCAAFMTCDRHPHQFVLAGLAIALERVMREWAESRKRSLEAAALVAPSSTECQVAQHDDPFKTRSVPEPGMKDRLRASMEERLRAGMKDRLRASVEERLGIRDRLQASMKERLRSHE